MKCSLALTLALIVASCGKQPADTPATTWAMRLDAPATDAAEAGNGGQTDPSQRVTNLPDGGIEVLAGPNATLWQPGGEATGSYRLSMHVATTNQALHGHGAGLVFGGSDVLGAKQAYTYFLVRGDGWFLIKTRDTDGTEVVCEWTAHAAVNKEDDESTSRNQLAVEVSAETTSFLVNGKTVHSAKTAELHTDGRYGARLVHDLDVRFTNLQLQELGQ